MVGSRHQICIPRTGACWLESEALEIHSPNLHVGSTALNVHSSIKQSGKGVPECDWPKWGSKTPKIWKRKKGQGFYLCFNCRGRGRGEDLELRLWWGREGSTASFLKPSLPRLVCSTVQSLNCSDSPTYLPIKVPKTATMTMLISIIQDDNFTALCHTARAIPRASPVSAHSICMSTYYFSCFTGVETEAPRGIGGSSHS